LQFFHSGLFVISVVVSDVPGNALKTKGLSPWQSVSESTGNLSNLNPTPVAAFPAISRPEFPPFTLAFPIHGASAAHHHAHHAQQGGASKWWHFDF
jgi:hypothetical protein